MERDKEIENLFYVFTVPPKVTEISASGGNSGGKEHRDLSGKKRKYDWDEIYENSKNVSTPYEPRIPSNPFSYKANIFDTNKMPSVGLNLPTKTIEPIKGIKGISSQGIEPKLEKKSYFDTLESVLPKSGISSTPCEKKSGFGEEFGVKKGYVYETLNIDGNKLVFRLRADDDQKIGPHLNDELIWNKPNTKRNKHIFNFHHKFDWKDEEDK